MCITDSEALPNNTKTNIVTVKKKDGLMDQNGSFTRVLFKAAHTKEHVAGREAGT